MIRRKSLTRISSCPSMVNGERAVISFGDYISGT